MRYYVKMSTGEKGPYTVHEIREAVGDGLLPSAAELRCDERESWHGVAEVLSSTRSRRKRKRRPRLVDASDELVEGFGGTDSTSTEDRGSVLLGLVAGFLGGIIVLLLVLRRGKPDTRLGVYVGAGVQLILFLAGR